MNIRIAKIFAVLAIVMAGAFGSSEAQAQARTSSASNVLSVDPLGLLGINQAKNISVQYEWKSSVTNSWAFRAALFPSTANYSSMNLGAAYRFYIADSRALTGLSVAPALDAYFITFGDETYTAFGIGGDVAYKWIFTNFAVEPMFYLRQLFTGGESGSAYSGLWYDFRVWLGYAW